MLLVQSLGNLKSPQIWNLILTMSNMSTPCVTNYASSNSRLSVILTPRTQRVTFCQTRERAHLEQKFILSGINITSQYRIKQPDSEVKIMDSMNPSSFTGNDKNNVVQVEPCRDGSVSLCSSGWHAAHNQQFCGDKIIPNATCIIPRGHLANIRD